MKKRLLSTLIVAFLGCSATVAQGVKPLPTLHTEGRWLVDKHGNHVVLHGVMDTPNVYFNGDRWQGTKERGWWDHYNEASVGYCLDYFDKVFDGLEQAKCNVFRLHLDPAWTNDPDKQQTGTETGEANISRFSEERLKTFLPILYLPLAEKAMSHGMYVVVRPPGVCPQDLKVGDYVPANYGTWSTGSTSKWGKAFKATLDHFSNISMTLSGTGCLIDIDKLGALPRGIYLTGGKKQIIR